MTCTIAVVEGNGVIMAADSAAVDGDMITQRKNSKIWKVKVGSHTFLIGFCGSYNEGLFFRYSFVWPPFAKEASIEPYLVGKLLPKLCKDLTARFGDKREDEMQILLGLSNPGRIFMLLMPSDIEEGDDFLAIGSGSLTAIGCMETLTKLKHGSKTQRMLSALEVSEKFTTSVRGPMQVESLGV